MASSTIVRTLKASGGDYTTIKAWLADMLILFPDLVTLDINLQLDMYNDWPAGLDETFIDFNSGFTSGPDNRFILNVPESERHNGTAGTGFWFNSSSEAWVFYFRSQHVTVDGAEASAPIAIQPMFGASGNGIIKNSILHNINSKGFSGVDDCLFDNIIMYLTAPSGSTNVGTAVKDGILRNVTAYIAPTSGGFGGDIIFHGCDCENVYLYHDRAKTSYDSFYNCTGDYNAGLLINGDIPGSNDYILTDDSDLVDPNNFDFRFKSTSPLLTAGINGGTLGANFVEAGGGGQTSDLTGVIVTLYASGAYSYKSSESAITGVNSNQLLNAVDSNKSTDSGITGAKIALAVEQALSDKETNSLIAGAKVDQLSSESLSSKATSSGVTGQLINPITGTASSYKESESKLSAITGMKVDVFTGAAESNKSTNSEVSGAELRLLASVSESNKSTQSTIKGVKIGALTQAISAVKSTLSAVTGVELTALSGVVSSIKSTASNIYGAVISLFTAKMVDNTKSLPTYDPDELMTLSETAIFSVNSQTVGYSVKSETIKYKTVSEE